MRKFIRNAVLGLAGAVALFAAPKASQANVTVSLVPESGVNLSALHVGQSFVLDVVYSSDNPSEAIERHFGKPQGSFTGLLTETNKTENPAFAGSFLSPPIVGEEFTYHADAVGSGNIFVDFTYADVMGYVETNIKSSYFINTNTLNFTVLPAAVPEPATMGLLAIGAVGILGRRSRRVAKTA